jgi:hypothetical protein
MERRLGVFETAETLTDAFAPFNVVGVIELETGISLYGLHEALARAERRHPLLRARIVPEGRAFRYILDDCAAIPLDVIERRDDTHWHEIAEAELNKAFDPGTGPLMRCTYLKDAPGSPKAELIVSFLHTIIDGSSAVNLVNEILFSWNAIAAGDTLNEPEELPLLAAVEEHFPAPYRGPKAKLKVAGFMARQLLDEIRYRRRARGTRQMPVFEHGRCRTVHQTLEGEDLENLIRSARRRRVTLNSALNAAMLISVQRRLYGNRAVPLRNFNFAMLRPYLEPPLRSHHLGSYHVMLRATVDLEEDQNLWLLAEKINADFLAVNRRGDKYLALLTVEGAMKMILRQRRMRMASTALAYTGPLKIPRQIGSIRIKSVRSMVSNLVLGPEYTAQARLWDGRLWWDTIFLDCDMDRATAAAITDDIFHRLREAGEEST